MKVKIEVSYDIYEQGFCPPEEVDNKILEIMKSIGAEWYAQGFNQITNKRDICFDLELEEK